MGRVLPAVVAVAGVLPGLVAGHGWIVEPPSRSAYCDKNGGMYKNTGCGPVMWEPQSVEGPDGYPASGPPDGKLASGASRFSALDEQGANRWTKTTIAPGDHTITWKLPANHATKDFRYFLTKPGWNPDAPLARSAFADTPFCVHSLGGKLPPPKLSHTCRIPATHSGYHIVYAIWEVADTANSFFGILDLDISGSGQAGRPYPQPQPQPQRRPQPQPQRRPQPQPQRRPQPQPQRRPQPQPQRRPQPQPQRRPQPQPQPRPQAGPSGKRCRMYDACKGTPDCCPAGSQCFEQGTYYHQCRPQCPTGWACSRRPPQQRFQPQPQQRFQPQPQQRFQPQPQQRFQPQPQPRPQPQPQPQPRAGFVADCTPQSVKTGSSEMSVSYELGTASGEPAIQFTVQFPSASGASYGSIGLRKVGRPSTQMAGLDLISFDSVTRDRVEESEVLRSVGAPTADSMQDSVLVSHRSDRGMTVVKFYRKLNTGNDFTIVPGEMVNLGWAFGEGTLSNMQYHQGNKLANDVVFARCASVGQPPRRPPQQRQPPRRPPQQRQPPRRPPQQRQPPRRPPQQRQPSGPRCGGICYGGTGCYARTATSFECRTYCPQGWECAK